MDEVDRGAGSEPTPEEGAEEVLACLRERLSEAVRRVAPHWLAGQHDDLVQVAMLRVMASRRTTGEEIGAVPASYLWKAAYTATMDELRRRRRKREVSLAGDDGAVATLPSPSGDPEREASSRELGRAIQGCLGALIRPRRLAVMLHLQGHTLKETAGLLDWSPKRTENLIYRGLADLRRCLASKGLEP